MIRVGTRRHLPSPGSAASSPSSPPNPYPRSDPCWARPKPGGRFCRRSAPGSSFRSVTTPAPTSPRNSAGRWPRSSRAGPSPNPHNRPRCPCSLERPVEPRAQWARVNHSGNSGRLCFSRGSLDCCPIARPFACPMTAPTRPVPFGFISNPTTFPQRRPTGARSRRGRYERGR